MDFSREAGRCLGSRGHGSFTTWVALASGAGDSSRAKTAFWNRGRGAASGKQALAQLRRAFPTSFPKIGDFAMAEPADYPDGAGDGYAQIQRDYIDPIERAYRLSLRITIAIANEFGAHG